MVNNGSGVRLVPATGWIAQPSGQAARLCHIHLGHVAQVDVTERDGVAGIRFDDSAQAIHEIASVVAGVK